MSDPTKRADGLLARQADALRLLRTDRVFQAFRGALNSALGDMADDERQFLADDGPEFALVVADRSDANG